MYSAHAYVKEYKDTRLEGAIEGASPHRLVGLLLRGARERIQTAVALLEQGDIARKGAYISAAFNIVDSLRSSLDHQAGGEIADGLESIYDYVGRRLVEAHAQNDTAKMKEADRLLGEIEAAWLAIPAAG